MFLAESTIQLVPDGTLLLHLLMVVVMVAVVNRTLLKPINKILADRDRHILGRVDEASEMIKTREKQLAEYESALSKARSDGYHLLERERSQAVKEKEDKIKAFKEETARVMSAELRTTHEQEQRIRGELEGEAAQLGGMITDQILRRH